MNDFDFFFQTYLEQSKTKFNSKYQGMNLSKITATVGLNSKLRYTDIHSALVLFEVSNCIEWINFYYILSLTFWYLIHIEATVRNHNSIRDTGHH